MTLSICSADTSVVRELPDTPALTPTELKATFDGAADNIKTWLNTTHISEVESALENKQDTVSGITSEEIGSLSGASSNIQTQINTLASAKQKAITSGTSAPSGGSDGDIYLQYT